MYGIRRRVFRLRPKRPLKIFNLQAEIDYDFLRERFQNIPITDEQRQRLFDNLVVTDRFKMRLDDAGVQHIAQMILEHFPGRDVDIICIDPLYNVFDGGENNASENDNQAMFDFLQNKVCKLRDLINPKAGIILTHHTKKIDKKTLESEPFQAFSGASSLRRFYTSGMLMYFPEGETLHRKIEFELRNGPSIPTKTVMPENGFWSEVDPLSARIVNQKYGAKLDQERDRKKDVIVEAIAEEALKGHLYVSANQFSEAFENKAGLGGAKTIRDRISVLATKGHIKYIRDIKALGIDVKLQASKGILCVKDMIYQNADGQQISIFPTHYKCPQTSATLPVEKIQKYGS